MPALGRRRFLAGMAAVAASAASGWATGCGSSTRRPSAAKGTISVANFPFYIDAETNRGFTAATGVDVDYHEEVVDEVAWLSAMRTRLASGEALGRDVVVVSDWVAAHLANAGALSALPRIVWAQGMVGIAYDRAATGRDLTRITDLFANDLHGRVALPLDARSTLGMALLADGVDPSTASMESIDDAAGRLGNSVRLGQLMPFDHVHPIDKLTAGTTTAVVVRASDMVGLSTTHPTLRFVVPDEGGLLTTDVAAVTASSSNAEGAVQYLDYVQDADHAAARFRALPVMWDGDAITSRLQQDAPAVVADPLRNPSTEVRARLHGFRLLADDEEVQMAQTFADATGVAR